jgi:DNA repair exonuclease SbcCD ATPase subunit
LDDEIKISFDTESTLKSGETRDKFSVKILRGESLVDYAACSSGEKRRMDVAILLSLQSLIFERSASNSNLIVFDEVFDSLDTIGIERVVNLLSEEASEKAIFCVSHINELRDYFQNIIIVKKKDGISYLEN